MKPQLAHRQSQQLALTPQLRQALAVLQMSALELEAEVAAAIECNPLLEWTEEAPIELGHGEARQAAGEGDEAPAEGDLREADPPGLEEDAWRTSGGGHDDDGESAAERQAVAATLQDHLREQLRLSPLGPRDLQIGIALIDAIDDDGYLRESLDDIAGMLAPELVVTPDMILPVLRLVQQFDPLAVGSRNLGECLSLQLAQWPESTPARALALRIAGEVIEQLPRLGVEGIARHFACTPAEAEAAIALLRRLDPRPGARIGVPDEEAYVIPDAVIWRDKGIWRGELTARARPPVGLNRGYARLAAEAAGSDGQYLRGQLQEARWLLRNIEQRGETLLRVLRCLIHEQAAFLEFGESALRPLTLREVAVRLELHESTISRAIARKYVRTPRGTLALRDFFASGIDHEGGAASSTAVQAMIRELVDAENPRKPLSDSALVERLRQAGVVVARRTVAKYREQIGIASSHERVRL